MASDDNEAKAEIDAMVAGLNDWRGEKLAKIRELIRDALPEVEETWKYRGSPVWEQNGAIAVGNAHQNKVKLTFPQGAHLDDPVGMFNNGLDGNAWRAIDIFEGDSVNERSFKALVKRAARYNASHRNDG